MGTFNEFEEIKVWIKARGVTNKVYQLSNKSDLSKDFGLRDQMRRASVSIMANIAEGHGRRTKVEFANFLNIACGSAIELQSHLYIAKDLKYVSSEEFEEVYALLEEISKMTVALAKYLRN